LADVLCAPSQAQLPTLDFAHRGFTPIYGLIPPLQLSALRRYFRWAIRTGQLHWGDAHCPRRYCVHNDAVAVYFHHQLTSVVAAIAGEAIRPSYVYAVCYLDGEKLEEHVDREQCEYTVSLALDYSPEPFLETPWPIHLRTANGTVTVFQALGDGLLFRGRELPHWRGPLAPGHSSTSIFFHYVKENFTGSLE
jgi:hypothetical protein